VSPTGYEVRINRILAARKGSHVLDGVTFPAGTGILGWGGRSAPGGAVKFRVLGPVELFAPSGVIAIKAPGRRALLAALLLAANQVVPVPRLVDAIWGQCPPPSAVPNLRNQVAALRRTLSPVAPGERLVTRSGGYLLVVKPGELDLTVFETLVRQGRYAQQYGRPADAAEAFGRALGLWRGEPLANVAGCAPDVARLDEARLTVVEEYVRARLNCGEFTAVVEELQGLVVRYPLRESLWELLMLALYRSGRQADALIAYGQARTRLAEELGLDPGPNLREAQLRILTGA